jgi:hypothetical protein
VLEVKGKYLLFMEEINASNDSTLSGQTSRPSEITRKAGRGHKIKETKPRRKEQRQIL